MRGLHTGESTAGRLLVSLLSCVLLGACSSSLAPLKSPDNNKEVRVLTDWSPVPDHTVFIQFVDKGQSKTVYVDGEDRKPYYVQIVWSPDSSIFGVLEIDHFAENLWFAFDVRRQIS